MFSTMHIALHVYNHRRGWDLCQTGGPLSRFRRSVPVTYTTLMYDTQLVNALAPRGYIACTCKVWCDFHVDSGIIAITRQDNVYRYRYTSTWYIRCDGIFPLFVAGAH